MIGFLIVWNYKYRRRTSTLRLSWDMISQTMSGCWKKLKKDQIITPTSHEMTDSRGTSFEGTRDGEGSCKDREEKKLKHCQEIIT